MAEAATPTPATESPGRPLLPGLAALAVAAFLVALFGSARGVGISPDSCNYLSMAENVLEGRGPLTSITPWHWPGDARPLNLWPPLFPALLAALRAAGLSQDAAPRLLLAASLSAAVVLAALIAHRLESMRARVDRDEPGRGPVILTGILCLLSVPVLHLAFWVWSDLPCLVFVLCFVYSALRAWDPGEARPRLWLVVAAAACAAALLTRYAAFGFWILLLLRALRTSPGRPGPGRGFAVGTAAAATLPFAAWLLRNRAATGSMTQWKGPRWGDGPVVILEALKAGVSDVLPFPAFGHSVERLLVLPPRDLGAIAAVATAGVLCLLPGAPLRSLAARIRAVPGAGFLLGGWLVYVSWIGAAQFQVGNTPFEMEQRYLSPAHPLLLAPAVVLGWSGFRRAAAAPTPFVRGARIAVLLWCAYAAVSAAACVAFARMRPGYGSAELQSRASSLYLPALDAPRFCTDAESEVYALTRRPVKLLPQAARPAEIRALVDGAFDGVLVIHKRGYRWRNFCATLEQLLEAGLERNWERVADFPDCAVFRRRS